MPSNLGRRIPVSFKSRQIKDSFVKAAPTRVPVTSPWLGLIPDINAGQRQPSAMKDCKGLVVRGGFLTTDSGWTQIDSAKLPLGHNGDAIGFTDLAATTYGAGGTAITTGGNDVAQPIVMLDRFQRFSLSSGLGDIDAMVLTADTGTVGGGGPPHQETAHLFRKDSSGSWVPIEFSSTDGDVTGGPNKVSGASPAETTAISVVDSTTYTPGISGGLFNAGADEIEVVAESVFIWCDPNNNVMYFPSKTGSSTYTDFQSYAKQCQLAATTAGFGIVPDFNTFKAQSLASFEGRVVYFNTEEDGDSFSTRLRWSRIGNPMIVWPNFEVDDGVAHFLGVGAGWADLSELRTPGQHIEVIGNVLACYTKDGIAFMRRASFNPTNPFSIQYITKDRGLLAPRAVSDLGGGIHFIVMTDGWFLLDTAGTLAEAGRIGDDSPLARAFSGTKDSNIIYKWKRDFYERLDQNNIHRLQTNYDPIEKFVRITAPMKGGDEVWIFDIQNDRAFKDSYLSINTRDQSPTAWGNINRQTETAETWASLTPQVWASLTPQTWASFASSFGENASAHGDKNGFVYVHDAQIDTQDGQAVSWFFELAPHHFGLPSTLKMLERVWVEYENQQGQIISATLQVTSELATVSAGIQLDRGSSGQMISDPGDIRVAGTHHSIRLEGTGRAKIHSLGVDVTVEADAPGAEANRAEGS